MKTHPSGQSANKMHTQLNKLDNKKPALDILYHTTSLQMYTGAEL